MQQHPLIEVGELELNQNSNNYFAEVEQVAFAPAHVVRVDFYREDFLLMVMHSATGWV